MDWEDICSKVVVLSDTLTGSGVNYRLTSLIMGNKMDTEIKVNPYAREQRLKLFQERHVVHSTLPYELDYCKIEGVCDTNANYDKEL